MPFTVPMLHFHAMPPLLFDVFAIRDEQKEARAKRYCYGDAMRHAILIYDSRRYGYDATADMSC